MVRKALQRNGILAGRNIESDVCIETDSLRGDGMFVLRRADGTTATVRSIGELLGVVRETDLPPTDKTMMTRC